MKKDSCKRQGFSLAEALITLLIVCLITIASIPVLTKKKRNLESGSRGLWMCAINSSGRYVVYDSKNPVGEKDKPDTWKTLKEGTTYCRFDPPSDAKNVSVTLIGGGGAGATGVSKLEPILDEMNPVFRPTETLLYRLTMIGGGGGGAHGSSDSSSGGSGGAAGAFYVGNVTLPAFYTYGHSIGVGGNRGPNIDYSQSSEPWSPSGGDTRFFVRTAKGDKDFIVAHGGGGGQARTCYDYYIQKKCGGGNPSTGGVVEKISGVVQYTTSGAEYIGQGMPGTNTVLTKSKPEFTTGGAGTTILVNGSEMTYGSGGRGVEGVRSNTAEAGHSGYFSLDKFNLFGGLGGEAAVPNEYTFPKINGHLRFVIGRGGTATEERATAGEPTQLEYWNRQSKVVSRYYGVGGAAGISNKDHNASAGSNSYWTRTGGGTVGTCADGENPGVTNGSQTAYVETGKCDLMLGTGGLRSDTVVKQIQLAYASYDLEYPRFMNIYFRKKAFGCSHTSIDARSSWKNWTNPINPKTNKLTSDDKKKVEEGSKTVLASGEEWSNDLNVFKGSYCNHMWYCSKTKALESLKEANCSDGNEASEECNNSSVKDLVCMFKTPSDDPLYDKFRNLNPDITTQTELNTYKNIVNDIVNTIKTDKTGPENSHKYLTYWTESIYNGGTPTDEHGFKYECLLPEYKQVSVPYGVYRVEKPPVCGASGAGDSFGAGGGGGAVNENYVGAAGLGGPGANGAVIIRW